MLEKLLKLKHWQLFLLILMPIFLLQLTMFATISSRNPNNPGIFFGLFGVLMLVVVLVVYGWQYAIIFKLREKMPQEVELPYGRINLFFFILVGYMVLILLFMASAFGEGLFFGMVIQKYIGLILPLHLLSMFGIFHTMYFAAKTLKCAQTGRNQSFGDFAGEFFLIWFYIIGIWILQPRINEIVNRQPDDPYSTASDILDSEF